jgi:hypothetical protein
MHRQQIDDAINTTVYRDGGNGGPGTIPDPPPRYDDEERRLFLLNDESLYDFARSEGVAL